MVYQSRNVAQSCLVFRVSVNIPVFRTTQLGVAEIDMIDQRRDIRQIPLPLRIAITIAGLPLRHNSWQRSFLVVSVV